MLFVDHISGLKRNMIMRKLAKEQRQKPALSRAAARLHGQPGFAVPALRALQRAGHDIAAVYSQPPRPAGRGHAVRRARCTRRRRRWACRCARPARLKRDTAAQAAFAALELDAAVVAAYGLILPQRCSARRGAAA